MPSAARRKKARANTNGVGEAADGAENGLTESVATSDCEMVSVDFEGRVPVASDTGGIAQLLGSLLPRAGVDWQQLAQLLTSEEALGCVLKQCWDSDNSDSDEGGDGDGEGEDVYGVCGILSLHQHRQNAALQRLCCSLLQRCRDSAASADTKQRFADILSLETAEGVGLLINERVANLPAQVALPLLTTLSSELSEARAAAAEAGSDALRRLTHLLLVCRLHSGKSQPGASSPSPAAADDPAAAACDDQPVWVHSEEATVQRHAGRDWFQFSVAAECGSAVAGDWDDDDPALTPCRRVLLLPLASLAAVVDQARRDDSRQRHTG